MTQAEGYPEKGLAVCYGALRSGTTLLRLMLDSHSEIACTGEHDFMLEYLRPTADGGFTIDKDGLVMDRIFRASGLSVPQATDGVAAFWEMVRENVQRTGETKAHVLMLHRCLERVGDILPQAPVIHLLRDPRDVARSSIGMGWSGNTWNGVEHWLVTERDWDASRNRIGPIYTLRYEDLLEDPRCCLTELCHFLGVDYSAEMQSYSDTSNYDSIDPSLSYQWKRKQSEREVSEVEFKVGQLLVDRGYSFSPAGPSAPGLLRRGRLSLQNRAHIWKVRFERFGLWDPLLVAVTRKLGMDKLGQAARLRMEKNLKKFLK